MLIKRRFINGQLVEYSIDGKQRLRGDKIAANPIVRIIGQATGCIDPKTGNVKPESGCGKMKARLNAGMSVAEAMKLRLQGK